MKALKIECFDENNNFIESVQVSNVSFTRSYGHLYHINGTVEYLAGNINHWSIDCGLITIYYDNGYFLEISRIHL